MSGLIQDFTSELTIIGTRALQLGEESTDGPSADLAVLEVMSLARQRLSGHLAVSVAGMKEVHCMVEVLVQASMSAVLMGAGPHILNKSLRTQLSEWTESTTKILIETHPDLEIIDALEDVRTAQRAVSAGSSAGFDRLFRAQFDAITILAPRRVRTAVTLADAEEMSILEAWERAL